MDEEIIDDSPLPEVEPEVEPEKPKDPIVVPDTPKDTTPEEDKPKTPTTPEDTTDDQKDKPKKPEDHDDDVTPETPAEVADVRYAADPILDLFLNNLSIIAFMISFEVMQFFKSNIMSIFKK